MSEITDYLATQNTGRTFIFLFLVFAFLIVIAYASNKENRERSIDAWKASCDADKQSIRDYANLMQINANNTAQIKELINTNAKDAALTAANNRADGLQQQMWQMMFNNGQAISSLSNKLNLTETECDLKSILAKKANAPFTAAVSTMFPPFIPPYPPRVVVSNGSTGSTGGTEGAA